MQANSIYIHICAGHPGAKNQRMLRKFSYEKKEVKILQLNIPGYYGSKDGHTMYFIGEQNYVRLYMQSCVIGGKTDYLSSSDLQDLNVITKEEFDSRYHSVIGNINTLIP